MRSQYSIGHSIITVLLSSLIASLSLAAETEDKRRESLNVLYGIKRAEIKDVSLREDVEPKPELKDLLARLQRQDQTATVTWFRGHVDSFTSAPKATIPDYAKELEKQRNLLRRH